MSASTEACRPSRAARKSYRATIASRTDRQRLLEVRHAALRQGLFVVKYIAATIHSILCELQHHGAAGCRNALLVEHGTNRLPVRVIQRRWLAVLNGRDDIVAHARTTDEAYTLLILAALAQPFEFSAAALEVRDVGIVSFGRRARSC